MNMVSATEAPGGSGLRPDGTVVLLLSNAADPHWAAERAVELSAEWAESGRRVVLADLNLEQPSLHAAVGVPNHEGFVDIFLYGASLSRIATSVRDGSFYLIPTGTYAPDATEIFWNSRWKKLVVGFRETNATLVLFAPAESVDLQALSVWASEVIVLGSDPDPALWQELREAGLTVLGVLTVPATPVPTEISVEPLPDGVGDADVPPTVRVPTEPRRVAEPELELPPRPTIRPQTKRMPIVLWLLLGFVVIATVGFLVASFRPDLVAGVFGAREAAEAPATTAPPPVLPPPTRLGELLPYSVQVRAFTSLAAARAELVVEQRRMGSAPFFISPEEIQGIVYYRILSGFLADTVAATELRDRLVQLGAVDAADAAGIWSLIQFAPLAFDFGEYTSVADAGERADSLLILRIPTYAVPVLYSDGSRRWQLYGGAYRDSLSASRMKEILEERGVTAPLTARMGEPTLGPE